MTIEEISEYKNNVLELLFDVQVSVSSAKYIGTATTEDENWVKNHPFFKHYFFQLRFILIIQLAKLLTDNDNEKYNFHKFLRRLESSSPPEVDELKRNNIASNSQMRDFILDVRSMLNEFKDDIDVLIILRNKVYAHKGSHQNIKNISWQRIEALSELTFDVYNKINGAFYSGEFSFPNKKNWGPEWVIKRAAETRHKTRP